MKEQYNIDDIFKAGLKNFEPEFNELHWEEMDAMLDAEHPVPGNFFSRYSKYFYSFSALFLVLAVGYIIGSYAYKNSQLKSNNSNVKAGVSSFGNIDSKNNKAINSDKNIQVNQSIVKKAEIEKEGNADVSNGQPANLKDTQLEQKAEVENTSTNPKNNNDRNSDLPAENAAPNSKHNTNNNSRTVDQINSPANNSVEEQVEDSKNDLQTAEQDSDKNNQTAEEQSDVVIDNAEVAALDVNEGIQNDSEIELTAIYNELAENENSEVNARFKNTNIVNALVANDVVADNINSIESLEGKFTDFVEVEENLIALQTKNFEQELTDLPKVKKPLFKGLGIGVLGSWEMNYVDNVNNNRVGNSQGLLVQYDFGKVFSLETAFILTKKAFQSRNVNNVPYVVGNIENSQVKYSFIEIPLLARFNFRKNKKFRPHLGGGHSVYIPKKEKYFFVTDLVVDENYANDYNPAPETSNYESFEDTRDTRNLESEGSNIFDEAQSRGEASSMAEQTEAVAVLPLEEKSGPFFGIVNFSAGFDLDIARKHTIRLEGQFKSSINKLAYDLRIADYPISNEKRYKSLGGRVSYIYKM